MATNLVYYKQSNDMPVLVQRKMPKSNSTANSSQSLWENVNLYRVVIGLVVVVMILLVGTLVRRKTASIRFSPGINDDNAKVDLPDNSSSNIDGLASIFASNLSNHLWDPVVELNVTCSGSACNEAATEILSFLNTSVDPCDNFYDFACQRWESENTRPDYKSDWSVLGKMEKESADIVIDILSEPLDIESDIQALTQAKLYFKKCMQAGQVDDDATVQRMLNILEKFGGWPMLYEQGKWDSSRFNMLRSMAALRRHFDSAKILDIRPLQSKDAKDNSILISRPTGSSSDDSFAKKITELGSGLPKDLLIYKDFIVNVSRELLHFKGVKNINETKLDIEAFTILVVQSELETAAERQNSKKLLGFTENVAKSVTLEKLQRALDKNLFFYENELNLRVLFKLLFVNTNVQISNTEKVAVTNLDYLFGVSMFLSEVKEEAIANYLHFQMAFRMLSMVSSSKLQGYLQTLKNSMDGTSKPFPRNEECAEAVQKKFSLVLGHKFVQMMYPDMNMSSFNEDFEQTRQLFNNIKTTFRTIISSSTQLDFLSRGKVLMKLYFNDVCLGYPQWIYEESKVQTECSELSLRGSDYFEQTIMLNEWATVKKLKTLRQPGSEDICQWSRFIGGVGPYNHQLSVYVPLGILRTPFMNMDLPKSIVYGKLGSILGHELAHGFFGDGWTELKNEKTEVANCLIKYYNNFKFDELPDKNSSLNGEKTLEENIADNAGILAAYRAFKADSVEDKSEEISGLEKYTADQLFYIGFAQNWCKVSTLESMQSSLGDDEHSPGRFRVLGTLQNSKEFSEAWNCPVGSNMNPEPTKEPPTCQLF